MNNNFKKGSTRNLLLVYTFFLIVLGGLASCEDNPVKPKVEAKPFPLTYKFINVSDSTPVRFETRFAAYYPKVDSSTVRVTGLNNAAIGYQIKETLIKEGYPGVQMMMVFSVEKLWPTRTITYYYVERCIVEDSAHATMSFVWPNDTALADVHAIDPDTTDPHYQLWGPDGIHDVCIGANR